MEPVVEFTLSQAWAIVLTICGGLVTISAAAGVIFKIVTHFKKPNLLQDERIARLEKEVSDLKDAFDKTREEYQGFFLNDKQRLDKIEEGTQIMMEGMFALLSHGIDGNDIEHMIKAKNDFQEYLIKK